MTEVLETFCPECGYSLRGLDSDRCPECGHAVDRLAAPSAIPWIHRRAIGVWRAYWRTVWLVTFQPQVVTADVQRPVNFNEAQKFRWMTAWIAFAPLALTAAAGFFAVTFSQSTSPAAAWRRGTSMTRQGIVLEWLVLPVWWLAIYLFVLALTGIHSYFFHPRALPVIRQNRAVALSYYACAPLAWTPVTFAAIGIYVAVATFVESRIPLLIVATGCIVLLGPLLFQLWIWWLNCLRFLRRTTQCGAARMIFMGIMLPVLWLLLLIIVAIGFPAAYAFVCLIVLSLL